MVVESENEPLSTGVAAVEKENEISSTGVAVKGDKKLGDLLEKSLIMFKEKDLDDMLAIFEDEGIYDPDTEMEKSKLSAGAKKELVISCYQKVPDVF